MQPDTQPDEIGLATVEASLHRLYIAASGTCLRKEDRKKAREIAAFLGEIARVLGKRRRSPVTLVDAAAGKAYVGLLAAELLFEPRVQQAHVILIEREAKRATACRQAIAKLGCSTVHFTVRETDVADGTAWPEAPDLVVALHACGTASDTTLDRAIASRARHVLLVPCCTSAEVPAAALAARRADELGLPRHAEVRRRFIQSIVDAERTLRLEAAGYETTLVPFVPPTVTTANLLWRARRVGEAARMARAAADLRRLRGV
jgi:hypothetical protein